MSRIFARLSRRQFARAGFFFGFALALAAIVSPQETLAQGAGPSCVQQSQLQGLVAWWPGDNNANDIQNGNNGTLQGGATFAPGGQVGPAFQFNGTGAEVAIAKINSNLDMGVSDFSVDAWVFVETPPPAGKVQVRWVFANYAGNPEYALVVTSQDKAAFGFRPSAPSLTGQGNDPDVGAIGTTNLNDGRWHFLVGVRQRDTARLYVDGVLEASTTNPLVLAVNGDSIDTSQCKYARIGGTHTDSGHCTSLAADYPLEPQFKGLIDEVEVFKTALTPGQIQALYNAGSAGKCKPGPTGSLAIKKVVTNPAPLPPLSPFPVTVTCKGGGNPTPYPLSIPANTSSAPINNLRPGSQCQIAEAPLPSFTYNGQTCSWQTPQVSPNPVTIVSGSNNATVTNSYTCAPTGALTVKKVVSGPAVSGYVMPTFPITVDCNLSGVHSYHNLSIQGNTSAAPITGLVPLTICGLVETTPLPAPPPGCTWQPPPISPAYAPAYVTIASGNNNATVTNTYTCTQTGTLQIVKQWANTLGIPKQKPVSINVSCPSGGFSNPSVLVPLSITLPFIHAPSQCAVTENPLSPVSNVAACGGGSASWVPTYSPLNAPTTGVALQPGQTTTVTVTNTATCKLPPTGVLTMKKIVVDPPGAAAGQKFLSTYQCKDASGTPDGNGNFFAYNGSSFGSNLMTLPSTCQMTETLPPPFSYNGQTCRWQPPTYTPSLPVTVNSSSQTVTVTNSYTCKPQNGFLVIDKKVTNATWPNGTSFSISANCSNGYNHTATGLVPGNSWGLNPMPSGTTCTITEPTLPPSFTDASGQTCTWSQTPPLSQTVTIGAGQNNATVTNSYTCTSTSSQTYGWSTAILQGPATFPACTGGPVDVAGATSCPTAITAAQALFATLLNRGCQGYCQAGQTPQMAPPKCVPDPYTLHNGDPAMRWQINFHWTCH